MAGDVHDVGVTQHRPVLGAVGHRLAVHGLLTPQPLEHLVRRPVDVAVGVVEIDAIARHDRRSRHR